jgi:excisionase family DNA binding protein
MDANSSKKTDSDIGPLASWLTQKQLAEQLDVSQRTLERMRTEGNGPSFSRAGRRIMYHAADVESWLRANRFSSTAKAKHGAGKTAA